MFNRTAGRRRAQRRPDVESLEERCLLVGNMLSQFSNGNLTLVGDGEANDIEVSYFGGDVVIRTHNGTTLNGRSGRTTLIENTNILPGNLTIKLGGGDDTVVVGRGLQIGGNASLFGGGGNDLIGVHDVTVDGNLKTLLGSGRDGLRISEASIDGSANIQGNRGPDAVSAVDSVFAGESTWTTSSGADVVTMTRTRLRADAVIDTSTHSDVVVLTDSKADKGLKVVTGTEDDVVRMTGSRVGTEAILGLGAGTDNLALGARGARNVFSGPVMASGSGGADGISEQANVFNGSRTVKRFESEEADLAEVEKAMNRVQEVRDGIGEIFVYREWEFKANPGDVKATAGGFITRRDRLTISGRVSVDAVIAIDTNGDGNEDSTVHADEFGRYSTELPLEVGGNSLTLTATDYRGREHVIEFVAHRAIGTIATFSTSLGQFHAELLDEDAPNTVANYTNYFGRDSNAIIHRSVPGFVVQGGGYEWVDDQMHRISPDDPVENEFKAENSNLRGTISTALSPNQPDSATNQWFINLTDNSFLDDAKHTVFGRVVAGGMEIVDAISALPVFNLDGNTFSQTPLRNYSLYSKELTGTLQSNKTTTVTGIDTLFTQELSVGSRLRITESNERLGDYVVTAIVSDTEIRVDRSTSFPFTEAKGNTHEPLSDNHFVFSDLSELLFD